MTAVRDDFERAVRKLVRDDGGCLGSHRVTLADDDEGRAVDLRQPGGQGVGVEAPEGSRDRCHSGRVSDDRF